jgi:hypothetical protein
MGTIASIALTASESQEQARHFSELINSLPVQLLLLAVYAGLAVLAFTRVARGFGDDLRWFRAAVVALGVFVTLGFLLGRNVLGLVMWPLWIQLPVVIWLFGMCLYYIVKAMTKVRPGERDPEAQARGTALEHVLDEVGADLRPKASD